MRIAFLTSELNLSYGWACYAFELSQALSTHGIEIIALTQIGAVPPEDSAEWVDLRPVLPRLVPRDRGFLARSAWSVRRVRQAITGCDLVHVIAEPYAPLALWTAGKRPLVVTAHGTYVPQTLRRRFVGRLYQAAYRRAHLIAVSAYTAGQVQAALPQAQPTVIHNGVHFAQFQIPAPAPAKQGPTVLAVGGVKARKGTHLLIAAIAQVRTEVPDVQLVITGRQDNASYLDQIQRQIAQLGVTECVHLVGQIPQHDLRGWYQHADVFALPSLTIDNTFEGFGLVFLEASACGLPVIGTTGSGVAEAVRDGETGVLVPQNDVPALAEAIIRLLTDAALRQKLGAAGRKYAQSQDWSIAATRVLALYQRILA